MSYQALYRSWRPHKFADFLGQPHVKQTLMNAVQNNQVAHAYLFCGPRGTGKTTAAKLLATSVNCLNRHGAEPCNECEACKSILAGNNVDVEEIDAASNRGVDEIRQLRDKVQYAPTEAQRKVYIVDEVHMLTTEAFNALLKTLEEPPGHTLFVLATTEPHKIPGTIVSRCQRFDFRRIAPEIMVERLRTICTDKEWPCEDEALWKIAEAADGGLRDALGLLEQTAAFGQNKITAEHAAHVMGGVESSALLSLVQSLVHRDVLAVMQRLMGWYESGKDAARIVQDVLQVIRDLVIVKLADSDSGLQHRQAFAEVARECSQEWLLQAMKALGETYLQLRYIDQPRLALESAILGLIPTQERQQVSGQESASHATPHATRAAVTVGRDVQAGVDRGRTVSQEQPKPARPRATGRSSTARKMEVLQNLYAAASEPQLESVRDSWDGLLQRVKATRIQTHAWLINGSPVLATADTLVIAFSSRIHRDAVMKPEERAAIESALAQAMGRPIQLLALVQADWDAFVESLSRTAAPQGEHTAGSGDLAERAIELFGKDRVVISDKE